MIKELLAYLPKIRNSKFHDDAAEHIPLACHYDSHSVITKNGELIQIVKVNGLGAENMSDRLLDVRSIIRESLYHNVSRHARIAVWTHTIRSRTNLDDPSPYPSLCSTIIHNAWRKKNYWHDKFVNTLYVTFVYSAPPDQSKDFVNNLSFGKLCDAHLQKFDKAVEILNDVTTNVVFSLKDFGAERLRVEVDDTNGTVHSEFMRFMYSILHLIDVPIHLRCKNMASELGTFGYAVGNTMMEIINAKGKKFLSALSIKGEHELPTAVLGKLLNSPAEFVITEIMRHADPVDFKKNIDYQQYVFNVSKQSELLNALGLNALVEATETTKTALFEHQISIVVSGTSIDSLDKTLKSLSEKLRNVGMLHALEDVFLENVFWAQIPGNFKFIHRMSYTHILQSANFTALHSFPAGKKQAKWGKAITLLRTEKGTPYFFNFHNSAGNAATLIVGAVGMGRSTLAHFLISESLKYKPSILCLTHNRSCELLLKSNHGKYYDGIPTIDPLALAYINQDENAVFAVLKVLLQTCNKPIISVDKYTVDNSNTIENNDTTNEMLRKIAKYFIESKTDIKSTGLLLHYNAESDIEKDFLAKLTNILKKNVKYMAGSRWEFNDDPNIIALSYAKLQTVMDHSSLGLKSVMLYAIIARYITQCPGKKIIFLDNVQEIICTPDLIPLYEKLFKTAEESDCIILSSYCHNTKRVFSEHYLSKKTQTAGIVVKGIIDELEGQNTYADKDLIPSNPVFDFLHSKAGTRIFLPAPVLEDKVLQMWHLTDVEFKHLRSMDYTTRLFILQQDNTSIAAELSLGGTIGILRMLNSQKKDIDKFDELYRNNPALEEWLQKFYDEISVNN